MIKPFFIKSEDGRHKIWIDIPRGNSDKYALAIEEVQENYGHTFFLDEEFLKVFARKILAEEKLS